MQAIVGTSRSKCRVRTDRVILMSRCMVISAAVLFAMADACKGIGVNLATSQPLHVDINMKLDVYQHSDTSIQRRSRQYHRICLWMCG